MVNGRLIEEVEELPIYKDSASRTRNKEKTLTDRNGDNMENSVTSHNRETCGGHQEYGQATHGRAPVEDTRNMGRLHVNVERW